MSRITKKQKAFTLVELMIVVAIIGILGAIAYPSYQAQVMKSGRADAKIELNDVAQRLQRCFTSASTYSPADGVCKVVDDVKSAAGITSKEGHYVVTVSNHQATTWTLTATAVAGTRQAKDTRCATFTLDQTGKRTATDSNSADATDECW